MKINFLGDSITEGHGCAEPAHFFVNRIAREYFPGAITWEEVAACIRRIR